MILTSFIEVMNAKVVKASMEVWRFISWENIETCYLPPMMKFENFGFIFEIKVLKVGGSSLEVQN